MSVAPSVPVIPVTSGFGGPTSEVEAETACDRHECALDALITALIEQASPELYAATHRSVDRVLFRLVLAKTGGNQRAAARVLGIARQTLRAKLSAIGEPIRAQDDEQE